MKAPSLIAALAVGLFVLTLFSFFSGVILFLHGPLAAGASAAVAGIAYTIVGGVGAVAVALAIAADAIAERRTRDPASVPIVTRAIRAAAVWPAGMLGSACTALTGEWPLLAAPALALVVMALQFPRRASIS